MIRLPLLLLPLAAAGCSARGEAREYRRTDRVAHAGGGYVVGHASALALSGALAGRPLFERLILSALPGIALAGVKELHDAHRVGHESDARDFIAGAAGTVAAVGLQLTWEF